MQIIHRSVGEPAEGSLTRYPRINQRELFSPSPPDHGLRACRVV
jgi:hypothetical protein